MPTRRCQDCGLIFVLHNKRSYRCKACQHLAVAKQKLESQRRRMHVQRHNETKEDISEAEIDARYQAALKESRRLRLDDLEPYRSYGWLYREPRS